MLTTLRLPSADCVDPLKDAKWDSHLASIPGATIFHSSAWARVLSESYGYRPCYFLREGRSGFAAFPVMEVSSWLTGRRGASLPFTDACGPIGADAVAVTEVREAAVALGRSRGWKYLEIRDGERSEGQESARYLNHVLDMRGGEALIWKGIESSARRAIRKGEENGLSIEFSSSPEALRDFFTLMQMTRRRHGAPPQPYQFFESIQRNVLSKGMGQVVLARHENEAVAGAVYLTHGRKVVYKFGASNFKHQNLRGNNLVMWSAIKHFANAGFEELDFGRSDMDQPGLKQFKLAWGTKESELAYVRLACASPLPRANHRGLARSSGRFLKLLPAPIFNSIGSLLYKHIG